MKPSASNIEIERKFLIRMPDEGLLSGMDGCVKWEITQTYLKFGPNGETRRVRRIVTGGQEQFIFTRKRRITSLSSEETEGEISASEYVELLKEADPARIPVEKLRYRIPYMGQLLEIDIYSFWKDRATLEIELASEEQVLHLPEWISVIRDVSDDFAYKNSMLAQHVPMEPIE